MVHSWDPIWHQHQMALWLIIAALAIGLVAYFWRGQSDSSEAPEQLLKRRYAKGELDKETYELMLKDLRK